MLLATIATVFIPSFLLRFERWKDHSQDLLPPSRQPHRRRGPPGHQTLQPTLVHPKPPPPHPPPIPSPSPRICSSSSPRTRTQADRTRPAARSRPAGHRQRAVGTRSWAARTAEAGAERRKDSHLEEPLRVAGLVPGLAHADLDFQLPVGSAGWALQLQLPVDLGAEPGVIHDVAEADLGRPDEWLHVLGRVGVDDVDVQSGVLDAIRFERNHEGFIPVRIGVAFLVYPGGALGLWVDPHDGVGLHRAVTPVHKISRILRQRPDRLPLTEFAGREPALGSPVESLTKEESSPTSSLCHHRRRRSRSPSTTNPLVTIQKNSRPPVHHQHSRQLREKTTPPVGLAAISPSPSGLFCRRGKEKEGKKAKVLVVDTPIKRSRIGHAFAVPGDGDGGRQGSCSHVNLRVPGTSTFDLKALMA
nr:hypothetical protein Iba_chr02bCG16400 [Ipomoea batatas]